MVVHGWKVDYIWNWYIEVRFIFSKIYFVELYWKLLRQLLCQILVNLEGFLAALAGVGIVENDPALVLDWEVLTHVLRANWGDILGRLFFFMANEMFFKLKVPMVQQELSYLLLISRTEVFIFDNLSIYSYYEYLWVCYSVPVY